MLHSVYLTMNLDILLVANKLMGALTKQLGCCALVNKSHPQLGTSFLKKGKEQLNGVVTTAPWAWSCSGSSPTCFLKATSSSPPGTEEFFDPTADASCMNTYTRRDHVFAKLNLQLQRGTVTLSHREPGAPQTDESAFMQLEFSGSARDPRPGPPLWVPCPLEQLCAGESPWSSPLGKHTARCRGASG